MNEDTLRALAVPLNPKLVTIMAAGPAQGVPYLETVVVIQEANATFGVGNWGFVLDGRPFVLAPGLEGGKGDVWGAVGHVTLAGGEAHGDMGTNVQSGAGSAAVEMAAKGAVSDCMKRCLSHLADRLGLILKDKQTTQVELDRRWREYMQETGGEIPPPNKPNFIDERLPVTGMGVPYGWANDYKRELKAAQGLHPGVDGKVIRHIIGAAENSTTDEMIAEIDAWIAKGGTIPNLMSRAVDLVTSVQR